MDTSYVIKISHSNMVSNGSVIQVAEVMDKKLGSFHLMDDKDRLIIASIFNETVSSNNSFTIDVNGKSPFAIYELAFLNGSVKTLGFTYESHKATLHFSKMEPFVVKLPKMYVRFNNNSIYLFFIASEKKGKQTLYRAYLPNVSYDGGLCEGSSNVTEVFRKSKDLGKAIEEFMKRLFENEFSHSNVGRISLLEYKQKLTDGSYMNDLVTEQKSKL